MVFGKSFEMGTGDTNYSFTVPQGWGFGETSAQENKGYFTLFPILGGYGCTIEFQAYENGELAKNELDRLQATFSNTVALKNGFEVKLKKAFYACRIDNNFVIQIWYSLPKSLSKAEEIWNELREAPRVSKQSSNKAQARPDQECFIDGWVHHHPNNSLHVLFETKGVIWAYSRKNHADLYLLEISGLQESGYFYIKWDQKDLDKEIAYKAHIMEIKEEITKLCPDQSFAKETIFDQEQHFAYLKGSPYSLFTLAGDGFLFGFALKNKHSHAFFKGYDINDYVNKVKWWKD